MNFSSTRRCSATKGAAPGKSGARNLSIAEPFPKRPRSPCRRDAKLAHSFQAPPPFELQAAERATLRAIAARTLCGAASLPPSRPDLESRNPSARSQPSSHRRTLLRRVPATREAERLKDPRTGARWRERARPALARKSQAALTDAPEKPDAARAAAAFRAAHPGTSDKRQSLQSGEGRARPPASFLAQMRKAGCVFLPVSAVERADLDRSELRPVHAVQVQRIAVRIGARHVE